MITTTIHLNRSTRDQAQLQTLAEIRKRRRDRIREIRAKRAAPPLTVKAAPEIHRIEVKQVFAVETLKHFDALFVAVGRLSESQPQDGLPIARALLSSLLRLSWARLSGKPLASPEASTVPHRLFQRQAATKAAMRRLNQAIGDGATITAVLEASRALLIWLASDQKSVIQ